MAIGDLVPRCDLWGVANPEAPIEEWRQARCCRPFGHRGLCSTKHVRFAGQPKAT